MPGTFPKYVKSVGNGIVYTDARPFGPGLGNSLVLTTKLMQKGIPIASSFTCVLLRSACEGVHHAPCLQIHPCITSLQWRRTARTSNDEDLAVVAAGVLTTARDPGVKAVILGVNLKDMSSANKPATVHMISIKHLHKGVRARAHTLANPSTTNDPAIVFANHRHCHVTGHIATDLPIDKRDKLLPLAQQLFSTSEAPEVLLNYKGAENLVLPSSARRPSSATSTTGAVGEMRCMCG